MPTIGQTGAARKLRLRKPYVRLGRESRSKWRPWLRRACRVGKGRGQSLAEETRMRRLGRAFWFSGWVALGFPTIEALAKTIVVKLTQRQVATVCGSEDRRRPVGLLQELRGE